MKKKLTLGGVITLLLVMALFTSCEKEYDKVNAPEEVTIKKSTVSTTTLYEDFETGSKTAYAAAYVTLATGSWYFNNALLGTLSTDKKVGTKSSRIYGTGIITMKFDYAYGASTVSVYHAAYGTDANSTWGLYVSTNSGSTWTQVGSTLTTTSTLTKVSFTVNLSGNVRFEIRKLTGTTTRINIDEFVVTSYSGSTPEVPGVATRDDNMGMGNPSGAVANVLYPTNYLMTKTQYTLSYNNTKLTCNWASWHLSTAWLGTAPRTDVFTADATLPTAWYHVVTTDYTNSGFDRGHMCPSADRTGSTTDNAATFLMTNIIPQAPNNNQITWAAVENYCRDLVAAGNELYIISGPYGQGGTGSVGTYTTISTHSIVVPSYTWKIIVVLPVGSSDVSRVTTSTRVIAVWMPNTQTCSSQTWGYYRKSVDYIESMTGFNFLSNVSTTIQAVIEASVDAGATS